MLDVDAGVVEAGLVVLTGGELVVVPGVEDGG